jgi:hypothetical protein
MAFFKDPIRGVNKWYGARTSGGQQGPHLTDGYRNEYVWDLKITGLGLPFPTGNGIVVTGVDTTYATGGALTAATIGGVSVLAATDAAPVSIPEGNTGVVVLTGPTGGKVVIQYKNVEGDATHNY